MEKIITEIKNYAKKYKNYILMSIDETNIYYLGWVGNPFEKNQDLPIIFYDKKTNNIKEIRIPPNDDEELEEIWNIDKDKQYLKEIEPKLKTMENGNKDKKPKQEDKMADTKKLRYLLKKYGASDYEIENFIEDYEADEEEFSPYSKEIIDRLKQTDAGKQIIKDMPKTKKDELIKKIKEHFNNENN